MRLENKVAFISGAHEAWARSRARLFAQEGCSVAIGDLREDEGQKIEAEINETGGQCLYLRLDVTSEENWQQAIAATVARFGKLDILVNNAGIYRIERVEGDQRRVVGPGHGYQQQGGISGNQACHTGAAQGRGRLHHQHLLRCGSGRQQYCRSLHRLQRSGALVH